MGAAGRPHLASRSFDRPLTRSQSEVLGGTMTWLRDDCPQCDRQLVNSRFDTAFRMPDGSERLCFAIPAALCAVIFWPLSATAYHSVAHLDDTVTKANRGHRGIPTPGGTDTGPQSAGSLHPPEGWPMFPVAGYATSFLSAMPFADSSGTASPPTERDGLEFRCPSGGE